MSVNYMLTAHGAVLSISGTPEFVRRNLHEMYAESLTTKKYQDTARMTLTEVIARNIAADMAEE